jgi:hypothetical protein
VVRIGGIIPTLCASRKDEAAMKDAVLWTAARPLESKLYRFASFRNGTGACLPCPPNEIFVAFISSGFNFEEQCNVFNRGLPC